MKPQLQPRSIRVLRHAPDFCASWASSPVFSLATIAVLRTLLTQEPDAISNPTTPSRYDTGLPHLSSQSSANQIP